VAEQYDNSNTGALFKNIEKDDAHPNWADYQGSIETCCSSCGRNTKFWLSAWIKVAKKGDMKGKSFMSLAAEEQKKQSPAPPPQHAPPASRQEDFDDDIPF